VTVLKRVEAAAMLADATCAHGADIVRPLGLSAPIRSRSVIPVHRADVVAVGSVLGLQFPVAVVDIRRGAAQDLETVGRLVDDQVDDLGGLTQVGGERGHIGAQAAEQEAAVGLEPGNFRQVVRAVLVEVVWITRSIRILYFEELAGIAERPTVERTGVGGFVTALKAAKHGSAMAARIDKRVQVSVTIARDDDGLTAHVGRKIIVDVRDLAFMRQISPVALEDVFHLEFKDFTIGKDVATDAVDTASRVVLHRRFERFLDSVEHWFLPFLPLARL
jgi:hypothetical protein